MKSGLDATPLFLQVDMLNKKFLPRPFTIFEITRTIYSNSALQWKVKTVFYCSWRSLISSKLEQLEIKLEKIIGI